MSERISTLFVFLAFTALVASSDLPQMPTSREALFRHRVEALKARRTHLLESAPKPPERNIRVILPPVPDYKVESTDAPTEVDLALLEDEEGVTPEAERAIVLQARVFLDLTGGMLWFKDHFSTSGLGGQEAAGRAAAAILVARRARTRRTRL